MPLASVHFAHDAAERVDLADDLPLRHAADGRVATHLRHGVGVHREQARFQAEARRGHRGLDARVPGPDHDDIEPISQIHERLDLRKLGNMGHDSRLVAISLVTTLLPYREFVAGMIGA